MKRVKTWRNRVTRRPPRHSAARFSSNRRKKRLTWVTRDGSGRTERTRRAREYEARPATLSRRPRPSLELPDRLHLVEDALRPAHILLAHFRHRRHLLAERLPIGVHDRD